VRGNGFVETSRDLQEAQAMVARHLARRGAKVITTEIPGLEKSLDIWSSMMAAFDDGPSFSELLAYGKPFNVFEQLALWALRRSPHTLPALGLALAEKLVKSSPARMQRFIDEGLALKKEIVSRLGPKGIMLYPSYASPAPRHYEPLFPPTRWVYTAILNVLELPVTQVPLGLNARGLPVGVQVAAVHGNDHLTIAVAMELERTFGGWHPPAIERLVA